MNKKLVLGFFVLLMFFPCSGEIHSKRGSSDDFSMEIFWDDTVSPIIKDFLIDKEMDEILFDFQNFFDYYQNAVTKLFIIKSDVYISYILEGLYNYEVGAMFGNVEDNYHEVLYYATFKSFNEAKKEFDQLCAEYYKKLEK